MVINIENLSIYFKKGNQSSLHLKDFFLSFFKHSSVRRSKTFFALKNINLSIKSGEVIGIIGSNGSGKSTLLRAIAGIYSPSDGEINIKGRVGALLDIGSGFHPELSGHENLYLNCALLGLSRYEIKECVSEIVKFADIGESLHEQSKYYSTGMNLKLGFSIVINGNTDILIIDELFAGADNDFIEKAKMKLSSFINSTKTVIIVSHDLEYIRYFCTRLLWIDGGSIKHDGDVNSIIEKYLKSIPI